MERREDEGGDARAFEEIARTYRAPIYRICYRYTGNREDAEDIVQDVLLRAYRGLAGFRGDSSFRTWLYRIAVNACLSWVSGQRATEALPLEIPDTRPTPAELFSRGRTAEVVRRAVRKLPERQRITLVLRVYEELSHKEIGEILGCPVGTAKANFFFALKNLHRHLKEAGMVRRSDVE